MILEGCAYLIFLHVIGLWDSNVIESLLGYRFIARILKHGCEIILYSESENLKLQNILVSNINGVNR